MLILKNEYEGIKYSTRTGKVPCWVRQVVRLVQHLDSPRGRRVALAGQQTGPWAKASC